MRIPCERNQDSVFHDSSVSSNSGPVDISDIAVGVFFLKKQMFSSTVIWKRKNVPNSSVNPAVKG
jgi:hypothetical protein